MAKYEIQVSEDKNSLAIAASDFITQVIESTLKNKTRAKIALCGGSTPKAAYSLLGKKNINWMNVDLFLGDERWVDNKSQDSNCFLLNNSLFKEGYPSLEASFFGVSTVDTLKNDAEREGLPTLNNELFNKKQLLSCDLLSTHLSSPRNKSTLLHSRLF